MEKQEVWLVWLIIRQKADEDSLKKFPKTLMAMCMTKLFRKTNLFVCIVGISFMVVWPVAKGNCAMSVNDERTDNDLKILENFSEAVQTGDIPRATKALNDGADVNKLFGTGTPLGVAIGNGDKEMVKFLIEHGADIFSQDGVFGAPLHQACLYSNNPAEVMKEIALLLINSGADLEARDYRGSTPLNLVLENNGDIELAKLFIERGANVNSKNNEGNTPLQFVLFPAKKAALELLIKNSADVNIKNNDGWTPLMRAAIFPPTNGEEIVKLLLTAGADVNVRNNKGDTVLTILEELKSRFPAYPDDIISLLKAHGAVR